MNRRTIADFLHVPVDPHEALTGAVERCVAAQRAAVRSAEHPRILVDPLEATSAEALDRRLKANEDVSDVRIAPELSNCVAFHTGGLPQSIESADVSESRTAIDVEMLALLYTHGIQDAEVVVSGHFFYPPRGYMSWHTNSRVPGLRAYLTWVDVPGSSWFRYRDPVTEQIETSVDTGCDLRLFRIDPDRPFWHCVQTEVDRFSFGYRVVPATP